MDAKVVKTAIISASFAVTITIALQQAYHAYINAQEKYHIKQRAAESVKTEKNLNYKVSNDKPSDPTQDPELQEIIKEQLARNIAFLGEQGVENIQKSRIVVVGCGGVGSWVATMLARSGVLSLKIIDFDQVTLSSLNRHATATLEDVGTPKVDCVARMVRKIAPWIQVDPVISLWTKQVEQDHHLLKDADYVVDCIDNIDTKVDLLEWCVRNKIPVMSSMGAGCKGDPTRIRVGDISMSIEDPMSRSVRRRLRIKGIVSGIPAVFSTEKPSPEKAQLLELDDRQVEKGNIDELSVLQDFRVRILPVLGPLPGIFGLTMVTHILTDLGGYHSVYDPIQGGYSVAGKNRIKIYERALGSLVGQSARLGWGHSVPFDVNDIGYLIEEAYSGKTLDGDVNRISLTKWDPSQPLILSNVVPVSDRKQKLHEDLIIKQGKPLSTIYNERELQLVKKRQKLQAWYDKFRV